jgi:glycosyltransferase involved in cell wall biosynthesis
VKVFAHNFNPDSNSGPNKFTRTLFDCLIKDNKVKLSNQDEADVEFCLIEQQVHKVKPMVLRLDGIWFNSDQDYNRQNAPIKFSYHNADAVIFQSEFNKKLTEYWFGSHKNSTVIHNASDLNLINLADSSVWDKKFKKDVEVWSCASNWRPHKRLKDNIRYFLEFAPKQAVLIVAGRNYNSQDVFDIVDDRIYFTGELDYTTLLSLYKRSSTFIHLAYLDHCPNVVVDAQASGCVVICSSTGGTSEIITKGKIINEKQWNFSPIKLYEPPKMDFDNCIEVISKLDYDLESCSQKYYNIMRNLL